MQQSVESLFSQVDDPRVEKRCLHRLKDILFIAFCTLLSNGEDFEDMSNEITAIPELLASLDLRGA